MVKGLRGQRVECGDLTDNVHRNLIYLNTLSPVGRAFGGGSRHVLGGGVKP